MSDDFRGIAITITSSSVWTVKSTNLNEERVSNVPRVPQMKVWQTSNITDVLIEFLSNNSKYFKYEKYASKPLKSSLK